MYQEIKLIGNLGRDPEMRYTPNGQAVTNFSIAVNRKYTTGDGEKKEDITWFDIAAWGKAAEACNTYLFKGSKVFVSGRLISDDNGNPEIFTRNNGEPGTKFSVSAGQVLFLTPKGEVEGSSGPAKEEPQDDIPF